MIFRFTPAEADAWRSIRLESLQRSPIAFIQTYEDEAAKTPEQQKRFLTKNCLLGWRDAQGEVVAVIGFYIPEARRLAHQGRVFATYVRDSHRGKGIADRLMEALIATASEQVSQLHLAVDVNNHAARALYERHGFTIYGTHPQALCVDGIYYDDHLMVKML